MKQKAIPFIDNILLLGLLIVITYQLYLMFLSHEHQFTNPRQYINDTYQKDYITLYGTRFKETKTFFHNASVMGYIGETNESFFDKAYNFVMTQYYIAPNLVIRQNTNSDTILYNLYNTKNIDITTNYHLNNGWHIVKDFDNGLILIAK